MVTLSGEEIPEALNRLFDPPEELYLSGQHLPELLKLPRIGIVGSRKATPYGRAVTTKFASDLAKSGVAVVSGLAIGVDSIAQTACVSAGGKTIAVLPAGLDKIYPTSHHNLAQEIMSNGGLLVSEYSPGTPPLQFRFLARNRIIAALSEGLLITEAAARSGSLSTARHALDLGIPVFAVPGPITSSLSEGTNNLIKAGAVPVTSAGDILNAMNWRPAAKTIDTTTATEEERVILELIVSGLSDGALLLERSKLEAPKFNQALTMLELQGRIRPAGANHWGLT